MAPADDLITFGFVGSADSINMRVALNPRHSRSMVPTFPGS